MKVKFRIYRAAEQMDSVPLYYIQKKNWINKWVTMEYIPDGANSMTWTYNKRFKRTDKYFDAWQTKKEAVEFLKIYYNRK